jgi:hypothetical protein
VGAVLALVLSGPGCAGRDFADPGEDFGEFDPFVGPETHGYVVGHRSGDPAYQLHVFFRSAGEGVVFYDEGFLGHGFNPFAASGQPSNRVRIETTWSIASGELVVDDVMRCIGVVDDPHDRTILSCTLERIIVTEQTLGAVMQMFPGPDPKSPGDPAFADFELE